MTGDGDDLTVLVGDSEFFLFSVLEEFCYRTAGKLIGVPATELFRGLVDGNYCQIMAEGDDRFAYAVEKGQRRQSRNGQELIAIIFCNFLGHRGFRMIARAVLSVVRE